MCEYERENGTWCPSQLRVSARLTIHVVEERNKTRICHDGRAETGGICLNELLIGGPNIMNVLTEVLMKFRLHKIGLMTDIKAFFS